MQSNDEALQREVVEAIDRRIQPQLGRSRRAFLDAVASETASRSATTNARRRWWWLPATAGLAAAVAIAIRLSAPTRAPDQPPTTPAVASFAPSPVSHAVAWTPLEDQTVYVNGQVPARSIRGLRVDELRWFDPELKAHVRLTVPREQVVLTSLSAH